MEKVKIIHCADLHFDTPFRELSYNEAENRKEDLRETFGKMIELIKRENVDILLISGDLFDNASVTKTTLDYIDKKFKEIIDTKVFISPGNHDYYSYKSFYSIIKWPSNVHIFNKNLEKVVIPNINTCVYGIGFSRPYERQSLIENFCVEDDKYINIMVLHGDIVSKGQSSAYNPITIKQIGNTKLDYLALGHTHKHLGIMKAENTFYSYSGCLEGRGFDELGEKGVLLGEIGKGYCNLNFKEICKRKYFVEKVDIYGCSTYEEIIRKIHKKINTDKSKNLYKIHLIGQIEKGFSINSSVIEQKLKEDFYFIRIIDDTQIQIDYDFLEKEFSLKGIFVRNMRRKINEAKDEVERRRLLEALKIGMKALEDEELNFE
ncbi:DNA repair exonuclease [Crassaminicella thermophila]|uniref:DNA repair exonuclease n=1 Tax=Crassaminicella thermophila TaxID=2599308 RepID=A0A5C0SEK1_CRATE|nr:DNA repair exonuclease [Crassaminicella thermophila]QEK12863.1 DNA repair exonuclease [Crassaminicella thermophila]